MCVWDSLTECIHVWVSVCVCVVVYIFYVVSVDILLVTGYFAQSDFCLILCQVPVIGICIFIFLVI